MIKLLDEKGLTTVWAAIKNTFTSKSDADGKYAKKADLADYAKKTQAMHSMDVYHTATDIQVALKGIDDFPLGFIAINAATSTSAGVMTAADKKKFDGIASGANNYTLPVASTTALGGVEASMEYIPGNSWPTYIDPNNKLYTRISGLSNNISGSIGSVEIKSSDDDYLAKYGAEGIDFTPIAGDSTNVVHFSFPLKQGTFALTSDCLLTSLSSDITVGSDIILFRNLQQVVLAEKEGVYDISKWYKDSPNGSILDIYSYGTKGGRIISDQTDLFRMTKMQEPVP